MEEPSTSDLGTMDLGLTRGLRGAIIGTVLLLCLAGIAVMASDVLRKIDGLATSNSDNVQWTLTQVDVEYLNLVDAVTRAKYGEASLTDVRKRFDILYSRANTLGESDLFRVVHTDHEFITGYTALRSFLDSSVALMDGEDTALRAALPALDLELHRSRFDVKRIAMAGIKVFAALSDKERESLATTLTAVGVLTLALIAVLLGLVGVLLRLDSVNRDRAQENLLTLARMEAIVSTALDAVIVTDGHGRVIEFNSAAEQVFGYTRAEAMGRDMAGMIIPIGQRQAHHASMERYLQTGINRMTDTGRRRVMACHKDGTDFPIEVSVAKSQAADGIIFVSFLRDLSAQVAAEKELLKARDDALAGEKAKADLLAMMSHEMRTPLNGMIGMIELLGDTPLTAKQREFLKITRDSGELLLRHVNDVLDIARLESGKMPMLNEHVDLTGLIEEIFANQSTTSSANGNELALLPPACGRSLVRSDPFQLRQILLNLIGNAIKFTRNGRVTVEVHHLDAQAMTEFRIIDTGVGIPDADLERIFEDFVTLDTSYARSAGGTGLGLGITRRIVQNMGGTITAESQAGQGSVFRVRLPLDLLEGAAELVAESPAVDPEPARPAVRPLSVLVVEDNPINRLVVHEMLTRRGHGVQEAHDGEEGVRVAASARFDVILMDISMPRMDGVQATQAIRAGNGQSARTPIIALTAHALKEEVARFHAVGMQEVLVKPISGKTLDAALQRMIEATVTAPAPVAALTAPVAVPAEADEPEAVIDHAIVDDLFETLGAQRSARMMKSFFDSADATLALLLSEAARQQTAEDLRREVHKLCGSAAMFGAHSFNARLRTIEQMCKTGDLDQVHRELASLPALWSASRKALDALTASQNQQA